MPEEELKIAVLGGDERELYLIKTLLDWDFIVYAYAIEKESLPEGVFYCQSVFDTLKEAEAVILPMPGIKNDGILHCRLNPPPKIEESEFAVLSAGTPVICGAASAYLQRICSKYHLDLVPMVEKDEIAVPNAIPTAEGALAVAIENSDGLLSGSLSLIIGYGRLGQALAPRLSALGSNVLIVNREQKRADLARKAGFSVIGWEKWPDLAKAADYVFNTVPAFLIRESILSGMKKDALIVDLAASPGGTDFAAANKIGIKAVLAAGLPGKYSPRAAGKILSDVYPHLVKEKIMARRRGHNE
ncbi:MAG: dipicolinate synthase subunit DpsA [Clostridia bacterium]|nr:dipicolinate synthase subunit DpsA [Clostridia bacterium]MDD4798909.1 dipicolinate synthase subunit DpsA [Clostridia bacterium]